MFNYKKYSSDIILTLKLSMRYEVVSTKKWIMFDN